MKYNKIGYLLDKECRNFLMFRQFYSLRDTGIIEMLANGISPNEVKEQADHSSIKITNEYLKHANPKGIDSIKI